MGSGMAPADLQAAHVMPPFKEVAWKALAGKVQASAIKDVITRLEENYNMFEQSQHGWEIDIGFTGLLEFFEGASRRIDKGIGFSKIFD